MHSSLPSTAYARQLSPFARKHLSAPDFADPGKQAFFSELHSTVDKLMHGPSELDRLKAKMCVRHLNVQPRRMKFGMNRSREVLSLLARVRESAPPANPELEDLVLALDHAIPTYPFLHHRDCLIGWAKSIHDARAGEADAIQALANAGQASRDEKSSLSVQPTAVIASIASDASPNDLCAALSVLPKHAKSRSARQAIDAVHSRVKELAPTLSLLQTAALLDQARGRLQCTALLHTLLALHEEKFPQAGADDALTELIALHRRIDAVPGMKVEEITMVLRCILRHEGAPSSAALILCFKSLAPHVTAVTSQADLLALLDACTSLWRCLPAYAFLKALVGRFQTFRNIDDVLHAWTGRLRERRSVDLIEIACALQCTAGRDGAESGRGGRVDQLLTVIARFLSDSPAFVTAVEKTLASLGLPVSQAIADTLEVRYGIALGRAPMHGAPMPGGGGGEHIRARVDDAIAQLRDLAQRAIVTDETFDKSTLSYRGMAVTSYGDFVDVLATDCTAWTAKHAGTASSPGTATAAAPGMLTHRGRIVSLFELPGLLRADVDLHARASHQELRPHTHTHMQPQPQMHTQPQPQPGPQPQT